MSAINDSLARHGHRLQVAIDPPYRFIQSHHHVRKTVSAAPPDWWWIIIAAIDALTDLINPVFRKLQAPSLLISTQTALIESLAVDIATMIGIRLRDVEDVEVPGGFIVGHDRW